MTPKWGCPPKWDPKMHGVTPKRDPQTGDPNMCEMKPHNVGPQNLWGDPKVGRQNGNPNICGVTLKWEPQYLWGDPKTGPQIYGVTLKWDPKTGPQNGTPKSMG